MPGWFSSALAAINVIFGFLRDLLSQIRTAEERQAGRDEEKANTLRENAERNAQAREAEAEAEAQHRAHPDNDEGFDTSFRRD